MPICNNTFSKDSGELTDVKEGCKFVGMATLCLDSNCCRRQHTILDMKYCLPVLLVSSLFGRVMYSRSRFRFVSFCLSVCMFVNMS
jgi:hypothetical protein